MQISLCSDFAARSECVHSELAAISECVHSDFAARSECVHSDFSGQSDCTVSLYVCFTSCCCLSVIHQLICDKLSRVFFLNTHGLMMCLRTPNAPNGLLMLLMHSDFAARSECVHSDFASECVHSEFARQSDCTVSLYVCFTSCCYLSVIH
jgi:hypothetical protein